MMNYRVQGSTADGLKKALVRLFAELAAGSLIVATVLETATDNAEAVRHWAQKVMVEEMSTLSARRAGESRG
jgi:hypothetical protein